MTFIAVLFILLLGLWLGSHRVITYSNSCVAGHTQTTRSRRKHDEWWETHVYCEAGDIDPERNLWR